MVFGGAFGRSVIAPTFGTGDVRVFGNGALRGVGAHSVRPGVLRRKTPSPEAIPGGGIRRRDGIRGPFRAINDRPF